MKGWEQVKLNLPYFSVKNSFCSKINAAFRGEIDIIDSENS